jgi:predicted RecA/RadA family phage recombinase
MPASTFRHDGNHLPVASASGAIAAGALVYQEGFVGVAITAAALGASTWIEVEGVHMLTAPAGTVKGDKLYADLFAGESTSLALTKTAANNTLVGIAAGDRDTTTGKALVLLRRQPFTEVEAS